MLYFIANQTASTGKGAGIWKDVQNILREKHEKYEAHVTKYEGHASDIAREICCKDDPDICIVVVGGDGTMNEVINGMEHFDRVRFGMIPAGSGNDFARGMGIRKDFKENIERIIDGCKKGPSYYTEVDLGKVSWDNGAQSKLFGISSGVGMDAIVCKKALHSRLKTFLNKIHLGKLTYVLLTIQTLFSMDTGELTAEFDGRKKAFHKLIYLAAMNLRAEGGGVPMAPKATPYDGSLSICSASGIPKWRTFFCLPILLAAKHEHLKAFQLNECRNVKIHISKPFVLHADGEYCGDVTDVEFSCEAQKLHMIL
jgi:YegS/Rv2252/BmrU family lipid kinase